MGGQQTPIRLIQENVVLNKLSVGEKIPNGKLIPQKKLRKPKGPEKQKTKACVAYQKPGF